MSEQLMSLKEAAKYLGVSEATAYRRIKEKGVKPANYNPMLRRQKEPRYSKTSLDELKEQCLAA